MIQIIKSFKNTLLARGGIEHIRNLEAGGFEFWDNRRKKSFQFMDPRDPFRESNPQLAGIVEKIDQPVYDSFVITAAATPTSFILFTQPIGNTVGGVIKTLAETNLTNQGQLPEPDTLRIMRIGLYIKTTVFANLAAIQDAFVFQFRASSKNYMQSLWHYLPAGFGPYGFTTQTNIGAFNNGDPGDYAARNLTTPIVIKPAESFLAENTSPGGAITLTVDTKVWCYLTGRRERAV